MTDPARDFRYTKGDLEIEAYQITPASRWQDEQWPDWIKKQRLADDINCVYTNADNPEVLWMSLPEGDVQLPYLAWVVKHASGDLGFKEALEMETWVKVVPIPPPTVHPPADGIPDVAAVTVLKPVLTEESLKNISGDVTELRNEMLSAIKMLQDVWDGPGETLQPVAEEALNYLKKCMSARTLWCTCAPGQCAYSDENSDMDVASCRQNSPLVS